MDVNQFLAEMQYDGARPNLFEVTMNFPLEAQGGGVADRKFTFMARASQLPGDSMGFATVYYMGREVKLRGNRVFPEWTVTVYNDNDFKVKNAFERWMNAMNSHAGNITSPTFLSATSYMRDARVVQKRQDGQRVKTYQMLGAFPVDISPIDLDMGAQDTVEEFTVTFQLQYWLSDTTDVQPGGLATIGII